MSNWHWVPLSLAIGLVVPSPAAAEDPFEIGPRGSWFLLAGVTGGSSYHSEEEFSGFVGGEVSLAFLGESIAPGFYVDGFYDFGLEHGFVTLGPEFALHIRAASPSPQQPLALGVDGGFAGRFGDDSALGVAGRFYASILGTFTFYARYLWFDDQFARHVFQVGMSIKFPIVEPWGGAF
ncbi:MAG: hypothetical protein AAGF12_05840 [Myxococcota bacterium]